MLVYDILNFINSEKIKIACKVQNEYATVKDLVQTKDRTDQNKPSNDNIKSTELATILPRSSTNPPGGKSKALVSFTESGGTKQQQSTAIMHQRKAPLLPRPQWHAPWKLMRVSIFPYIRLTVRLRLSNF